MQGSTGVGLDSPVPSFGSLNHKSGVVRHAHYTGEKTIDGHVRIIGREKLHVENRIHRAGYTAAPIRGERLSQVKFHTQADEVGIIQYERIGEVHGNAGLA